MSLIHHAVLAPDLLLVIAKGGSPSVAQWLPELAKNRAILAGLQKQKVTHMRQLIVSLDGSALSASQRKDIDQLYHDHNIACSTAVMTKSHAMRALFTVFRWLSKNSVMVFGMDDLTRACQFLKMTAGDAFSARQELAKVSPPKMSA